MAMDDNCKIQGTSEKGQVKQIKRTNLLKADQKLQCGTLKVKQSR